MTAWDARHRFVSQCQRDFMVVYSSDAAVTTTVMTGAAAAFAGCITCAVCWISSQRRERASPTPALQIFLPWKNLVFYDGPGRQVTDWATSGNYCMRGLL